MKKFILRFILCFVFFQTGHLKFNANINLISEATAQEIDTTILPEAKEPEPGEGEGEVGEEENLASEDDSEKPRSKESSVKNRKKSDERLNKANHQRKGVSANNDQVQAKTRGSINSKVVRESVGGSIKKHQSKGHQMKPLAKAVDLLTPIEGAYEEFRKTNLENQKKNRRYFGERTLQEAESEDFYGPINDQWENVVQSLLTTMKTSYRDRFPVDKLRKKTKNLELLSRIRKFEHRLAEDWQQQVYFEFSILKKVSRLRKSAMQAARSRGDSVLGFNKSSLERILLEFKLIPYKIRVNSELRVLEFREMVSGSFKGFLSLFKELILFLLLCFLPYTSRKGSRWLSHFVSDQRKRSFYLSFKSQFHRNLTFFLSKVNPFIKYIVGLVTLNVAYLILKDSSIREVAELIIFIRFYLYYKIFRLFIEALLKSFVAKNRGKDSKALTEKIQKTSFLLGIVFFIVVCVKEALRSILGESLIFVLLEPIFFWVLLSLFLFLAWKWRSEIASYLMSNFDHPSVQKLADLCQGGAALFICLPAVIGICFHILSNVFLRWVTQFDFAKKISARLLRVRIEGLETTNGSRDSTPEDYIAQFQAARGKAEEELINANEKFISHLFSSVQKWVDGESEERTMSVYGPRGAGKSSTLGQLQKQFGAKGWETLRFSSEYRIHTKQKMEKLLEEAFGPLEESSENLTKKIILVDDAQNFFLSTTGGFEAFRYFLDYINNRRSNLFWVVSFNEPSWVYLNSVLGDNQYFRYQFKTPIWSEEKIYELIHRIHKETDFKLNYDDVFKTTSGQFDNSEMHPAEQRYFRLLWEQAHGIPGAAMSLWLKSVKASYQKNLTVCLPRENKVATFNSLNKDMFFVYAAFIKHDSLRIREAILATNLSEGIIRQAFLRGMEEGFLEKEDEFYRISMLWFSDITRSLRGKNLIYGITG